MTENKLTVTIQKPVHEVYEFTTTPPNTRLWIAGIVNEETNEWPVTVGSVYTLTDASGGISKVGVGSIQPDEHIEWVSEDGNYHCRYIYKPLDASTTELEYLEWNEQGELENPFTNKTLSKLKAVIEAQ